MKNPSEGLNVALLSIHGLIRGKDLELGRDADTGGQTLYVVELAQALSQQPDVARVVLFTRRIIDAKVSADYGRTPETLNPKLQIVRIDAGPPEYLPKEQLWDHLDGFADNMADWFRLENFWPDILHSHYADAGLVGSRLSNLLGIPLIHTGHSLGRVKRNRLLASGLEAEQVEELYNMTRRIEAEELTLATAERVITSTYQEIEEQYELYDHYQPDQMRIIPPGTNLQQFMPPSGGELEHALCGELTRHLRTPHKPIILALSRPDKRKNLTTLVDAYGQSAQLQELANLIIVAGNRDDIDDLENGAQEVFHELLVAIDRHDLYGKVALPKHHRRNQVALIYRIAAASGGVFVNPALTEPFGLTLIEAAASGLPIVATEDGGPRDIMQNCRNGLLINPLEPQTITDALLHLLTSRTHWDTARHNGLGGVAKHYSWTAHALRYLEVSKPLAARSELLLRQPVQRSSMALAQRALVSDLDLNLIGDEAALQQLIRLLKEHRKSTRFVIATGRRLDQALKLMKKHQIPEPDVLITSSGTEIYYTRELTADTAWASHIDYQWTPHLVRRVLADLPGLELQPRLEQSRFKLSWYIDPSYTTLDEIRQQLYRAEQSVHVQMAFGQYLDILPRRASKGLALRHVAARLQLPLEHILVAGGSGADEDMMRGNTLAVVAANRHHEELSQLTEDACIYFADKPYAAGILEGMAHYNFLIGAPAAEALR
jgi:sucrose-phosphate synthase